MTAENAGLILGDAAAQVLESMFFTSLDEDEAPREDGAAEAQPSIAVDLAFHGDLTGRFQVRLGEPCARALAANFSGCFDPLDLTDSVTGQVMCELANMLCGATLSRLSPGTIFNLDPPQVSTAGDAPAEGVSRRLHTSDGPIQLYLHWERSA